MCNLLQSWLRKWSHPVTYWDTEEKQKHSCNMEQNDPQEGDAYSFLCINCYTYINPTVCPGWLIGLAVMWLVDSRLCTWPHSRFSEETVVIVGVLHVNHGSLVAFTPTPDKPHHQRWREPLSKSSGRTSAPVEKNIALLSSPMFSVVMITENQRYQV